MEEPNGRVLLLGKTPEDIVSETSRKVFHWFRYMNNIIGGTSFALALGCLGTNKPQIYAGISIIFIFAVVYTISNYFPTTLKELRKKSNKSELEEVILKGMEANFLSFRKTFREAPVYWLGVFFLVAVLFGIDGAISKLLFQIK